MISKDSLEQLLTLALPSGLVGVLLQKTSPLPLISLVSLARRLMTPTHTYVPGSKCPCGSSLDSSGSHISSSCSQDRSLHTVHNTVLRVTDPAARSQGLNTVLELTSFSSESDLPREERPDLTTTSWPLGKSLKVADLALASPVSQAFQYSSTKVPFHPERLLKKREVQKSTK